MKRLIILATPRIAAAIVATAGLALLAAACSSGSPSSTGSSGSPDPGGSANHPSAVAFASCMRSHGVPKWPDPTSDSQGRVAFAISVSKDGFDPHSPRIEAKANECGHLMPGGGVPLAVSP